MSAALELAQRALAAAEGDEAEAAVQTERSGLARFAASEVHQPTLIANETVQLRIVRDGRVGIAAGNGTGDDALRELAQRAAAAAELAPPDPDFPGLAPPAPAPEVGGFDDETAAVGPDDQARLVATVFEAAGDFDVYGFFTSGVSSMAIASSTGVALEQTMTDATTLALAAVEGASGYAEQTSWKVGEIDPAQVARTAVAKAERTRGADEIEPGSYRAVLEPYALGELLQYFAYDTFNGLALLEERSYAYDRIGESVFDARVSIADDALDGRNLPKAFDFEGTPKQRVQLAEEGVLRGVVWDRISAARAGNGGSSTGHAPPGAMRAWGPIPFALSMAGGDASSTDELVEAVGDGIYVTRLHYLGIVQPREGILTGMTRDGTFRIRDGRIAEPLVNLRFTVAVPDVLADVPALTRETTLVNQNAFYDERFPYGTLVPALATARFDITGTGSPPGI
ncbi:MAG: metallopeptidase TldD-related protein [Actinomycetota bacterium]|nr:metallopeptidase TldD-related protein [Actinomycetota bacterium]